MGNIQIIPAADGNESSIGYYNRIDLRNTVAGDMWVCGVNSYTKAGFIIGSGVLGSCLNISNSGNVEMPYGIKTTDINVNNIKILNTNGIVYIKNSLGVSIAEVYDDKSSLLNGDLVIGGNLIINTNTIIGNSNIVGVLSKYQAAPKLTSVVADIMARLLNGIVINSFTTPSTLTLPTETAVYSSLPTIDKSIDWSVINTGTSTGTLTLVETTGHTVVGNKTVAIVSSALFRAKITALNTAITYRMS